MIRKRGDAWQVVVWAGKDPLTGRERRVRRTVHGSKRDARTVEARLRTEVAAGRHTTPKVTVAEFVDAWLERIAPDRSPSTMIGYRGVMDRYVRPHVGDVRLDRLSTSMLDHLYGRLRASGGRGGSPLAPTTVRHVHALLEASLNQALRWGWIDANPATLASPPPPAGKVVRPPDADTARRILSTAPLDLGDAIALGLCGLRRSEMCALTWGDLDAGTVRIERAVVHAHGELVVKATKTRRSTRTVPLPRFVQGRLAARHERARQISVSFRSPLTVAAYVLSEEDDGRVPLAPDTLTKRYQRHVTGLGVTARFHDLRHVASQVALAAAPPNDAADYLGHARASTTIDVYGHAGTGGALKIADAIDGLFG